MPRPKLEQKAETAWKRIEDAIEYYDHVRRPVYERAWMVYCNDASLLLGSGGFGNIGMLSGAIWFGAMGEEALGSAPFVPAKINIGTTIIQTKMAALTTQKPTFNVLIYDPEKNNSEIIALVRWLVDYLWDTSEVQTALQQAYLSKALFGFGLLEITEVAEITAEGQPARRQLRVVPIPATRVLYDLNARYPSLEACRWIAKVVWMERGVIDDMEKVANWRNTDKVAKTWKFKPFEENIRMIQQVELTRTHKIEEDEKIPVFYYYDAYNRELFILAPAKDYDYPFVVLRYEKDPFPFKDFYPFVMLAGHGVPETFHPLSDYMIIEPHLELLTKFISIYMNHALRAIPKFAYTENALTEQGRRALSSPSLLSGIEVRTTAPGAVIQPITVDMPNQSLVQMIVLAEKYLNEAAGLTHYHRAEVPPRVKSATESSYLVQLSGVRGQHEAQLIEQALGDLAEKLYGYYKMLGEPVAVAVPSPLGVPVTVPVMPHQLPDVVRIEINAGSTAYTDRMMDRNDMIALMQILGELLQMGSIPAVMPILKHVLATFPQLNATDVMQIVQSIAQIQQMQALQAAQAAQAAQAEQAEEAPEAEEATEEEEAEEE